MTEALSTVGTLEGFFFGVDIAVISEMILSTEGFPTDVARIGPLISMRSLVDQEVIGLGKVSVAILADELFLWTGTTMTRGFHRVDGTAKNRNPSEISRVSLEVLPVYSSAADPLLHEGVRLVGGNGRRQLRVAGQWITGLTEVLLSCCRRLSLEP